MVTAARRHYDECVVADPGAAILPFNTPDGIDCIVYGAVLEHLANPFTILARHAEALSPDGMMLICVSNPDYWRLTEISLRGTIGRDAAGASDASQSRGFSLETMSRGLRNVNRPDPGRRYARGYSTKPLVAHVVHRTDNTPRRCTQSRCRSRPLTHTPALCRCNSSGGLRGHPSGAWSSRAISLRPVGGVSHVRVLHPLAAMASDPAVSTHLSAPGSAPEPGNHAPG